MQFRPTFVFELLNGAHHERKLNTQKSHWQLEARRDEKRPVHWHAGGDGGELRGRGRVWEQPAATLLQAERCGETCWHQHGAFYSSPPPPPPFFLPLTRFLQNHSIFILSPLVFSSLVHSFLPLSRQPLTICFSFSIFDYLSGSSTLYALWWNTSDQSKCKMGVKKNPQPHNERSQKNSGADYEISKRLRAQNVQGFIASN